jgi:outer membrane protein assembly factor BamB
LFRSSSVVAGALFVALALSACNHAASSPSPAAWTMYQNGLTHNAVLPSQLPETTYAIDTGAKMNGGLAYDGRWLYAATFAGDLLAIDPANGGVQWRIRADDVLMSSPIVAGGMVFVGSGTNRQLWERKGSAAWGRPSGNHWYAFKADSGAAVWQYPTVGEAMPSAAYDNGVLVFATGDNFAQAVGALTGRLLWKTQLPGVPTMASAMIDRGVVFLAATQGKPEVYEIGRSHTLALDLHTGAIRWSAPYGNGDCTPTVAQNMVFVESAKDGPKGPLEATGTNSVIALDEATGKMRWRYTSAAGYYTAVGSNERAIAGTYDGGVLYQSIPATSELLAFDAATGRVKWHVHTNASVKMSPVIDHGSVYAGDTGGVFYRLDARTGAVLAAVPYDRPYTTSPPVILGKTLFVTDTEYLRALPLSNF